MARRTLVRIAVGAVIALLDATVAVTWSMRRLGKTICRKDRADVINLESAAGSYAELHDGAFPSSLAELVRPDAFGKTLLKGTVIPLDPYGRAYRYEPPDAEFPFPRIWTYGRDGLPGGEDDDLDVGNWMFHW